MTYIAVMQLNNTTTFIRLPVVNTEAQKNLVEEDCEHLARRLGASFLYLEDIQEVPPWPNYPLG